VMDDYSSSSKAVQYMALSVKHVFLYCCCGVDIDIPADIFQVNFGCANCLRPAGHSIRHVLIRVLTEMTSDLPTPARRALVASVQQEAMLMSLGEDPAVCTWLPHGPLLHLAALWSPSCWQRRHEVLPPTQTPSLAAGESLLPRP
jgi:hypothetical protein